MKKRLFFGLAIAFVVASCQKENVTREIDEFENSNSTKDGDSYKYKETVRILDESKENFVEFSIQSDDENIAKSMKNVLADRDLKLIPKANILSTHSENTGRLAETTKETVKSDISIELIDYQIADGFGFSLNVGNEALDSRTSVLVINNVTITVGWCTYFEVLNTGTPWLLVIHQYQAGFNWYNYDPGIGIIDYGQFLANTVGGYCRAQVGAPSGTYGYCEITVIP